jgi:hypothetical protein
MRIVVSIVALALACGPTFAAEFTPADRAMEANGAKKGLPIALPIDPLGLNGVNADGTPVKSKLETDVIDKITALLKGDIDSAIAMAQDSTNPDPNGAACWTALKPIGAIVQKHPLVFTGEVVTDIQAARSAMIQLNAVCTGPQSLSCKTVFNDAITIARRIATLAPVSVRPVIPDVWGDFCAALTPISTTLTISAPAVPGTSVVRTLTISAPASTAPQVPATSVVTPAPAAK